MNIQPDTAFEERQGQPLTSAMLETEAVEWLQYYGYLVRDTQPSQEAAITALRAAQRFSGITVTGIYDQATRKMMATPRCGNADLGHPVNTTTNQPRTSGGVPRKFVFNTVVRGRYDLRYGLRDFSAHFTEQQCRDCIREALYQWSAIAPFTFTEADGNGPVDILYRWGSGLSHLNCPTAFHSGTNAHTFQPIDSVSEACWTDASPAGQIHFADDHAGEWDVERMTHIALHETGHALGLSHSYVQGSTMCSSANLDLSLDDISGMQALYADQNPMQPKLLGAGEELFQLLPNGLIYQRLPHPRSGWTLVDDNWRNTQIVNSNGILYLHHSSDGTVYQFGGFRGEWERIYKDPSTSSCMIAASAAALYMLLGDNRILQWTGNKRNWTVLPSDPLLSEPGAGGIRQIHAAGYDVAPRFFALLGNGTLLHVKTSAVGASKASVSVTKIWMPDPAKGIPIQMAFASSTHVESGKNFVLYLLFNSTGKILQLLDVDDPEDKTVKPGESNWRVVDEDPRNAAIACAGEFLYFWRNDRTLWEYLGQRHPNTALAGPVVRKVDDNVSGLSVAGLDQANGDGRRVVVLKSWGRIWERLT